MSQGLDPGVHATGTRDLWYELFIMLAVDVGIFIELQITTVVTCTNV